MKQLNALMIKKNETKHGLKDLNTGRFKSLTVICKISLTC